MSEHRRASGGMQSPGQGDHYDAAAIVMREAATVLILAERAGLEVLMLKRNTRSVFVGDMWVFPGGAVDPGDASARADAAVAHRSDAEASAILGVAAGGIAYWVAALRETFEEAGVLLAHAPGDDRPVQLRGPGAAERFAAHRDWVNTHEGDFVHVVESEGLVLDGAGVHYVGQWVTPLGPPRRYDTRFFVTAMPLGQTPEADKDEAVHHAWVSADDALTAHVEGEMRMLTPTVSMLQRLATFASLDEAMAAAASAPHDGSADEYVRIRYGVEGPDRIAYPGDADYGRASADTETGIIRWPRR